MDEKYLIKQYEKKKGNIRNKLEEFRKFGINASKDDLFTEIAYCICTPQTYFKNCQNAINYLVDRDLLFDGEKDLKGACLPLDKHRDV
jgi:N-glycosylase/DNA lyase